MKINLAIALPLVSLLLGSCVMNSAGPVAPTLELPVSKWSGKLGYHFELPKKGIRKPASVAATIIVVNPNYKVEESTLRSQHYSKVGRGFSASMGLDLEKVIVGKGMTVNGPYTTYDEITYSHKKGASLTLEPRVFITAKVKYRKSNTGTRTFTYEGQRINASTLNFDMTISGWIAFVMKEPLSKETMWIKKLELNDVTVSGQEIYRVIPQYSTRRGFLGTTRRVFTGYKTGGMIYDGKIDAMASHLNAIYPMIMQKFWTYIDAQEILHLKKKVREIRKLKRY